MTRRDRCINGKLFITSFPTPITATTPPLLAVNAAAQTLLSTPVHSSTAGGAAYSSASAPNSRLTARPVSSGAAFGSTRYVTQVGTSCRANSSREASTSVTTSGCAPDARAAASAMSPMGPAPHTTAPRPSSSRAVRMPCSTTLSGSSSAPSAYEMPSGSLCSHRAGCTL
ncbi:hypothetical protein RB600_002599 [Gaeumannomyces tritici]